MIKRDSHWATVFNCVDGGSWSVTQGQADYCEAYGHATNKHTDLEGNVTVSEHCPRCGEAATPKEQAVIKMTSLDFLLHEDNAYNVGKFGAMVPEGRNIWATVGTVLDPYQIKTGDMGPWERFVMGWNDGTKELALLRDPETASAIEGDPNE